ncbi:hypothetical protein Z043_108813 [Scleropages formosus]|nr:hypothetical protein Z043_108813 [Scleropages formosus]
MSSRVKPVPPGGGRAQPVPNGGSVKVYRPYRRSPYPLQEDRAEEKDSKSFVDPLDQQREDFSSRDNDRNLYQAPHTACAATSASTKGYNPVDRRASLYRRFYKQIQEDQEDGPADCVILSVSTQNTDYAKSIGHCLQDRGLVVEMIYLQAESGLTQALQDVRSDGLPLCILVEQTNVALSSCTIIIFSETLKIHRNMPKDQAMDFVMMEFEHVQGERQAKEPEDLGARAANMVADYLDRETQERHVVPPTTRHLLLLMSQGLHLYPEELSTLAEYVHGRQEHLQDSSADVSNGSFPERRSLLPSALGKPPPLLPTPPGALRRDVPGRAAVMNKHPPTSLLPTPGSYPKSKPPPLLSMHGRQGSSHGPPCGPSLQLRGSPAHHGLPASRGAPLVSRSVPAPTLTVPSPCGPLPQQGPRATPPSLKSLHKGDQHGLLPHPG